MQAQQPGPKTPSTFYFGNGKGGHDYIAQCHFCGYVTHGYLASGNHDRYCKERRLAKKCSVKNCNNPSIFWATKINLCEDHYVMVLRRQNTDWQKKMIVSTFENGWMPTCRVCKERPADPIYFDDHSFLMCQHCINYYQNRQNRYMEIIANHQARLYAEAETAAQSPRH